MPEREDDLPALIARFREGVLERIEGNDQFHEALNGPDPMSFTGLGKDPNNYYIDNHEALLWIDPTGYLAELRDWQDAAEVESHATAVKYVADSGQLPQIRDLAQAIRRGRIAPFIGAGCSAALKPPHKMPAWKESLFALITRIEAGAEAGVLAKCVDARALVIQNKFIEAGAIIYEADRLQLDNYVSTTYSLSPDLKPSDISGPDLLLPELTDGCIITTNFDSLIEKTYEHAGRAIEGFMHGSQSHHKFAVNLVRGDRCILKLHGDAADSDTYMFSTQQYDEAYGNPIDFSKPLPKSLRQIYVSHSLLFLGCSLEMDRTLEVFKNVAESGEFDIPTHYAIIESPSEIVEKQTKENKLLPLRIKPIWFPPGQFDMPEKLLRLAMSIAKRRVTI